MIGLDDSVLKMCYLFIVNLLNLFVCATNLILHLTYGP